MQKISYNTCKQQNLYAIENNSKAHNIMQHQNIYNEHQKNATPKYLKIECNKIFYTIENNSKAHNNKKHQSTYSKHQKQSATPKYCNRTQEFMYTKNLKLHTLECNYTNYSNAQVGCSCELSQ
jgi:hypothetical protein